MYAQSSERFLDYWPRVLPAGPPAMATNASRQEASVLLMKRLLFSEHEVLVINETHLLTPL